MAAFGGLTVLDIDKNGTVKVRKANVSQEAADTLNQNMLMFFTGVTRSADDILKKQSKAFKENKKEASESMHFIKEIGEEILVAMEDDEVDEVVGEVCLEHAENRAALDEAQNGYEDKDDAEDLREGGRHLISCGKGRGRKGNRVTRGASL